MLQDTSADIRLSDAPLISFCDEVVEGDENIDDDDEEMSQPTFDGLQSLGGVASCPVNTSHRDTPDIPDSWMF